MPCPDSRCSGRHDDPTPDDNGLWECPLGGNRYYQCVLCRGRLPVNNWWRASNSQAPGARGYVGDSRRYVHQHGWMCVASTNDTRGHSRTCECGQAAHTARSQCSLVAPPVLAHCNGCGEDNVRLWPDDLCTDCTEWENEACPARCSTPHAGPGNVTSRRTSAEFRCPETEELFGWCDDCCEWTDAGMPIRLNGSWYCDPYEHGYGRCSECDDWYYEDDGCSCREYEDDYDDDEDSRHGEPIITCGQCHTENTIFDEIREVFVCQCAANVLRERKVPLKVLVSS